MKFEIFYAKLNNTIINNSEEMIYEYASEWINYLNNEDDIIFLQKTISEFIINEDTITKLEILLKIIELSTDNKKIKKFKRTLNDIINIRLDKNDNEYLYLYILTYINIKPDIKSILCLLEKVKNRMAYIYLLRYCLLKKWENIDKKYISKMFELYKEKYQDNDYTPILWDKIKEIILNNIEYAGEFSNFISSDLDFITKILTRWNFGIRTYSDFIIKYPKLFWESFTKIIENIFTNRNYNIDYELNNDKYLMESICKLLKQKKLKGKIISLISNENNQTFNISRSIFCALIISGHINEIKKIDLHDYIILDIYYSLPNTNINKKVFYKLHKWLIDKNHKLNEEHRKKEEQYKVKKEKDDKKGIQSIIKILKKEKNEKHEHISCRNIFKIYLQYKDLFTEEQTEFVKDYAKYFLSSELTSPKNDNINIIIKKTWDNSRNTTFQNAWFIFDLFDCLKVSTLLNINLMEYKEKIITLLPYCLTNEFNLILNIFKDLEIKSINWKILDWLIDVYLNDKYWDLSSSDPCIIFKLINKDLIQESELGEIQINNINELYNKELSNNDLSIYDIDEIIESIKKFKLINKNFIDENYSKLIEKFRNYNYFEDYLRYKIEDSNIKEYRKLLDFNEILIYNYKDKNAINWRFDQINNIKNDYIRKDYDDWLFRWVSRLEDELDLDDRSDKKIYEPLLKNIKYPEYNEKFFVIFNKIKEVDEWWSIRFYLYKILKEYYKNSWKDNILNLCLNCNDNYFVANYMFEYLTKEEKEKFNNLNKDLKIWELNNKIDKYEKELIKLKKQLEKEWELNLYVEWKTDEAYLQKAKKELNIDNKLKINIQICWSSNSIFSIIAWKIKNWIWWIHIWLFDIDKSWIKSWSRNDISSRLINQSKKITINWFSNNKLLESTYWKSSRWYKYSFILLPWTERFRNQIFLSSYNTSNKIEWVIINNNYQEVIWFIEWEFYQSPVFTIEHLIYSEKTDEFFKKLEVQWWWITYIIDKDRKKELCEKIVNWEIILPKDTWINFKPIFDYLEKTYNDYKSI